MQKYDAKYHIHKNTNSSKHFISTQFFQTATATSSLWSFTAVSFLTGDRIEYLQL